MQWTIPTIMTSRFGGGAASSLLTGLVGWWSLDEASGTFTDSSGNGNTGTANGTGVPVLYSQTAAGANTVNSVRTQADTSGESRIDMGDPASLRLTSTGSIACWVQVQAGSSATPAFVSKMNFATDRNGYAVFAASAHPVFEICDGTSFVSSTCSGTTMSNGTWYHIVYTWDGANIKGYVNGSNDAASNVSQTRNATSTGINFTLGRAFNGTDFVNFGLAGLLDAVGVWSRDLTAGEVTTLYSAGAGKQYPF